MRTVGFSPFLNARSTSDLRAIRQMIVKDSIEIYDLQFLIGRDGRSVVADLLGISRMAYLDWYWLR